MPGRVDEIEARVSAGHDEHDRRQRHLAVLQHERLDVAGEMMHADERQTRAAAAAAFANDRPTSSEPTSPGPWVTATAPRSVHVTAASSSARSTTPQMSRMCWREASSGTTPPHSR